MKVYFSIEKSGSRRVFFKSDQLTKSNEELEIEFMKTTVSDNSNIDRWYKNGDIDKRLESCWLVKTFVTDQAGNCYERYNPMLNDNHMIDFKWIMEANDDNLLAILSEIVKEAYGPDTEAFMKLERSKKGSDAKKWPVNEYEIITRGFTVEDCIKRHKTFWDNWPYFDEPRRVWRDEYDRLCIEYVRKDDLTTTFYRYTVENGLIVWG